MKISSFKFAVGSMLLAGGLAATSSAYALKLNTSGLKANAVLTFSVAANGSTAAAGITFAALGNATRLPDLEVIGSNGRPSKVQVYNNPVTEAEISIGWDLKIHADAGSSVRSALRITNDYGDVVLANFKLDFKKKQLIADLIDTVSKTTIANAPIYDFIETVPQKIAFPNLVLNQSVTVGRLVLTPSAQDQLGDALQISEVLRTTLASLDWGTIAVEVTSYARKPAVSNKRFTLADVPPLAP